MKAPSLDAARAVRRQALLDRVRARAVQAERRRRVAQQLRRAC